MSTIDPGVEEGVKDGANNLERDRTVDELEQREEEDFQQPNRWWFFSTAFPLLAGTFGPIATGFNIIALSTHWRQTVPPPPDNLESYGVYIEDPGWVIAVNAVSLFSALVANAALLLNMARRLKFAVAQPLTILGFFIAGILLVGDLAALGGAPHYLITTPKLRPDARHALSSAFYYAIFAAALYIIIAALMCFTVYGALRGQYSKQFQLTGSQRTLMLQTMSFVAYLLLGALVYSKVEAWDFINSVYFADVTLLTVGFGDFSPGTRVGRGLLFPFATGGVLIIGLVVASVRSLILERGKQKMSARIIEKKRRTAVHNVDEQKQTVRISIFAQADFNTDPKLSLAQRREEEFNVMRKVQTYAATERKYFALAMSLAFALILWFVGALIFMKAEYRQGWNYFESLYFAFVALMTIGYGDLTPKSDSGKAFFVLWSILAVPSLTILISNMGDTIVKWVSDLTNWLASLSVLPGDGGFRASFRKSADNALKRFNNRFDSLAWSSVDTSPMKSDFRMSNAEYENQMLDRLAARLGTYLDSSELGQGHDSALVGDQQEQDVLFYHYVLARECRNLQKDLEASPPKQYSWSDWEYFLKLMGDEHDPVDYPGQQVPDIMVPDPLRAPGGLIQDGTVTKDDEYQQKEAPFSRVSNGHASLDGNIDRQKSVREKLEDRRKQFKKGRSRGPNGYPGDWSWLSSESPLMSNKSEASWVLERLSAALERELNRQRKGYRTKPPISLSDAKRSRAPGASELAKVSSQDAAQDKTERNLERAVNSDP